MTDPSLAALAAKIPKLEQGLATCEALLLAHIQDSHASDDDLPPYSVAAFISAVEVLGGLTAAANAGDVSPQSVWRWTRGRKPSGGYMDKARRIIRAGRQAAAQAEGSE